MKYAIAALFMIYHSTLMTSQPEQPEYGGWYLPNTYDPTKSHERTIVTEDNLQTMTSYTCMHLAKRRQPIPYDTILESIVIHRWIQNLGRNRTVTGYVQEGLDYITITILTRTIQNQ